jgi:hypothetical protein
MVWKVRACDAAELPALDPLEQVDLTGFRDGRVLHADEQRRVARRHDCGHVEAALL